MKKTKKIVVTTIAISVLALATYSLSFVGRNPAKDADIILTSKDALSLKGEVNDQSVSKLIKQLRDLDTDKDIGKPIYLVLYTPGGSIQAGLELIEATRGMRRPVKTITIFAASMGFQTAQNLDERLILGNGVLMSHKARGGADGEFDSGSRSQLDNRLNLWKQRIKELDMKTVERTKGKQTLKSYMDAYENELWLTGSQSVESGYADRVVTVRCDKSLNGTTEEIVNFLGMEIHIKFSACPLQTAPESVDMKIKTNKGIMSVEEFSAKGGILGVDCGIAASRVVPAEGGTLCSVDGNLTREKIELQRQKIFQSYSISEMRERIQTRF